MAHKHEQIARPAQGSLDELKRPWRAFVKRKKLHKSGAREAVVDAFLETPDHLDLQRLVELVRRRSPRTGIATVYRTMKLMQEAGLAQSRHFGPKSTLYEVSIGRPHHDHLICEQCRDIAEFVNEEVERLREVIAAEQGFALSSHRHELFGICAKCGSRSSAR